MPLTLIKEDGTGKTDANSYASVADGDAYHEGHLYATAWTGASADARAAALVMATRLIDAQFQFDGRRAQAAQRLQWPRVDCRDPDADGWNGGTVGAATVPRNVLEATCETARALIIEDRTANPLGEGLKFTSMGDLQQTFDKTDRRPVIPHVAQSLLQKFGEHVGGRCNTVRLVRS
jgi:hypothetical protein